MEQTVLELPRATRELWDLSEPELAMICRLIADGRVHCPNKILRAEATRLYLVWVETLNTSDRERDERERRVALLCGLRKRTIQILVRLSMKR